MLEMSQTGDDSIFAGKKGAAVGETIVRIIMTLQKGGGSQEKEVGHRKRRLGHRTLYIIVKRPPTNHYD